MKFIKAIDKKESGAPKLVRYAYLLRVSDIKNWYPPVNGSLIISQFPEMKLKSYFYRLYLTGKSHKHSFESVGNIDNRGFKQKLSGTHPGRNRSVVDFSFKNLDERFIIFIPDCDGDTLVLGTPYNPMILTTSHESNNTDRKFTFNFEQEIQDDYPYFITDINIEWDSNVIDGDSNFVFVLSNNTLEPIIYTNNQLLEI